jgi:hypothetical protein
MRLEDFTVSGSQEVQKERKMETGKGKDGQREENSLENHKHDN